MRRFQLGSEQLPSLDKTIEPSMAARITGERLRDRAYAARPGMLQEFPFSAKPVPRVAWIGEIALEHKGRACVGFDAIDLFVPAAGKPRQCPCLPFARAFREIARQRKQAFL